MVFILLSLIVPAFTAAALVDAGCDIGECSDVSQVKPRAGNAMLQKVTVKPHADKSKKGKYAKKETDYLLTDNKYVCDPDSGYESITDKHNCQVASDSLGLGLSVTIEHSDDGDPIGCWGYSSETDAGDITHLYFNLGGTETGSRERRNIICSRPTHPYDDLGTGKCVVNGEDPEYQYFEGRGGDCKDLCTGRRDCYGYSVSSYSNCLLWTEAGLSGGGEDWGGANCHVKKYKERDVWARGRPGNLPSAGTPGRPQCTGYFFWNQCLGCDGTPVPNSDPPTVYYHYYSEHCGYWGHTWDNDDYSWLYEELCTETCPGNFCAQNVCPQCGKCVLA